MKNLTMSKDRNPLQAANLNAHQSSKSVGTYTDQRILEIKKKYDTPNRKSNPSSSKENITNQRFQQPFSKKVALTEEKPEPAKVNYFQPNFNSVSIGRSSNEKQKYYYPEISKFGVAQAPKGNNFSTLQNFFMKPVINTKLRVSQTDQNFFKPSKPEVDIQGIRCKDSYSKLSRRQFQDSRIQNIDKINSKIKRILDCIDSCEKEQVELSLQKRSRYNQGQNARSSFIELGRSIISNNDQKNQSNASLQQTKILQKRQFYQQSSLLYQRSPIKDKPSDCIPSLSQMRSSHSNNQFSQYLISYKNRLRDQEPGDLKRSEIEYEKYVPRSTSCYDKLRQSTHQVRPQAAHVETNMDQINTEITKFQQKIADLQQQKRKLNIKFKPFYYESSPIKTLNTSYHTQSKSIYISPLQKYKNDLESKQKKIDIREIDQQRSFSKIVMKNSIENEQSRLRGEIQAEMTKEKCYDNFELRKKIEQRMEERRRKIEMIHNQPQQDKTCSKISNLINALCQQVKLDEQLRNSKNWLSECNNQQKRANLQSILRSRGLSLTEQQLNEQFNTINEDQSDPFFSFRQEKFTIQSVADIYLNSIHHWNKNICHQWNQQIFTKQTFAYNFFNKNEILIEDLVRLLNTQTGSFYRNRDVYLIYERIKKQLNKKESQKLSVEDLSQVFTRK